MKRRLATLVALILLSLALSSCTESNDFVREIATARVFLLHPGLAPTSIQAATVQVAEWNVEEATMIDAGGLRLDLLAAEACVVTDTTLISPLAVGKCAGGLVIDSQPQISVQTLSLRFTMQLRRAMPVDLPPGDDFDGDLRLNAGDNCPLIANPLQEDANGDGIGDACNVVGSSSGVNFRDSDADGIPDGADNCVAIANPLQENTDGVLNDFIGDACTEEVATVTLDGNTTIEFSPPPFTTPIPRGTFLHLVLDFRDPAALSCDWTAGSCALNPARVRSCVAFGTGLANLGCS